MYLLKHTIIMYGVNKKVKKGMGDLDCHASDLVRAARVDLI